MKSFLDNAILSTHSFQEAPLICMDFSLHILFLSPLNSHGVTETSQL